MSLHNEAAKFVFEEDCNDKMLPFSFDLKTSCLKYVASSDDIIIMKPFLENGILIGIDTERKPSKYNKKGEGHILNPTAVIQIAIRDKNHDENVFIVDLQVLSESVEAMSLLDEALCIPFHNVECIIIGHGLERDFRELHTSYPDLKCFITVNSVVETTYFVKQIDPDIVSMVSLKYLVQKFLNCNLVKTQQMSNWGLRPLSVQQLYYAACDALVLLRLYDVMSYEADIIMQSKADDTIEDGAIARFNVQDIYSYIDCSVTSLSKKRSHGNLSNNSLSHVVEYDSSTASLMKERLNGWSSPAAREWYSGQLRESSEKNTKKARTEGTIDSPSLNSLHSDEDLDDTLTLPLPKGQGSHMFFLMNEDALEITKIPSVVSVASPVTSGIDSDEDSDLDDLRSVGSIKSIISRNSSLKMKKKSKNFL